MKAGWAVGLDIGGTFTDVVMVHSARREIARYKCLTTPEDPSRGALLGLKGVLAEAQAKPGDISVVLHATTLVSNALIERKGARTALLSTKGFRDVLRIGREKKHDIYDLQIDKPKPLVPEALSFEVEERIASDGGIIQPLDEGSVVQAAQAMKEQGATAVAVCLLHSYMNAEHEQRCRSLLKQYFPDLSVSLSSDILPEIREFERASTTAANAFVQPVISEYLQRFEQGLKVAGVEAPLLIMLSEGGLAAPELVRRLAVRICESGPAAGAVTAASVAQLRKLPNVLSFDMGGTTAKTSLIHGGEPEITLDFEVARAYRFKKGSGLPLRLPVVDLMEIGAGGGSIVRVDELGLMNVGPDSAGADPGPACYGQGGTRPTVTDADLVLGYINANAFLGGRMQLDPSAARSALQEHVAKALRISVAGAALGVHEIVNENMANAARMQAVERGQDPSGYSLVAFGGAGPVHAWGVARRLRVGTILVPPSAGLGSAVGLLLAPRTFRGARTYIGSLDQLDWDRVAALYEEMGKEARSNLLAAGVLPKEMRYVRTCDLRYVGQRKELTIELPAESFGRSSSKRLRAMFERAYQRTYHRIHKDHPIEALAWRLAASGPPVQRSRKRPEARKTAKASRPQGRRPLLFPGWSAPRMCAVFSRSDLHAGTRIRGPAVIEESESTTVVGPGGSATVDAYGNLVLEVPKGRLR